MRSTLALIILLTMSALHAEPYLHPFDSDPISFSSLKGKWVLINYWASWCGPCMHEIPELNQFFANHRSDAIALFAVNYDRVPETMQKKLAKQVHIRYPTLKKDPATALKLGDIIGVPVTFVFNPQGQLVHTLYGEQTAKQLSKLMRLQA
jgi:thiol-disulfide isomerase/thioredoxin